MTRSSLLWTTLLGISCVVAVSFAFNTTQHASALPGQFANSTGSPSGFIGAAKNASSPLDGFVNDSESDLSVADSINSSAMNDSTQDNASTRRRLAKLITDVNAEDPEIRSAAIDALALEPKSGAAPVLQALLSARASEDRLLALSALHKLALNQGDDDGAIRNVVRLTVYESDDEELAKSAQAALEDLESGMGQIAPASAH